MVSRHTGSQRASGLGFCLNLGQKVLFLGWKDDTDSKGGALQAQGPVFTIEPMERPGIVVYTYNPRTRGRKSNRPLGLTAQLS